MRYIARIAFATLLVSTVHARAEQPDCSFPDFRARFNCYELLSRGPPAEPVKQVKEADRPKQPVQKRRARIE